MYKEKYITKTTCLPLILSDRDDGTRDFRHHSGQSAFLPPED